jgi:hypothetical protein
VVAGTDVRRRREEFSRSAADGNTVWVGFAAISAV